MGRTIFFTILHASVFYPDTYIYSNEKPNFFFETDYNTQKGTILLVSIPKKMSRRKLGLGTGKFPCFLRKIIPLQDPLSHSFWNSGAIFYGRKRATIWKSLPHANRSDSFMRTIIIQLIKILYIKQTNTKYSTVYFYLVSLLPWRHHTRPWEET